MGAKGAHHRQEESAQKTEENSSVNSLAKALLLPGPVKTGGQNIGAHGQSDKEIGQKTDDGGIGANRRQGVVPGPAAHHDDVRRVKEELQDAGEHQRQSKLQKLWQDCSAAHIDLIGFSLAPCHNNSLLIVINLPFLPAVPLF